MNEALLIGVVIVFALLIALAAMTLVRVMALARERDTATRDAAELRGRLEAFGRDVADHERDVRGDLATARNDTATAGAALRQELASALARQQQGMAQQLTGMSALQQEQLKGFAEQLSQLTRTSESRMEALRKTLEERLDLLRTENAQKLEQMRATVDEKLQATLEQRLGASFKQVSERLEQVHKGLGEMQSLATGVGDLKRVLTNVKSRGTWGEVQLGSLLEEILTAQQFERNVETRRGSGERVEYAIKLPGRGDDGKPCWLPIDCKFPLEDWQRLQDALERADVPAADAARKALAGLLRGQSKVIRDKYVDPPYTTDFAILFLPTEGLYAEMMARAGFAEAVQRESRVLVTGPMNLAALLNSL
ncbi:MAG: DNA recombination protein RmuC, partial [Burkholderiales bacterium]